MVKLFCAIVGVAGSAFPVDIDAGQTVGDLKDTIKAKNSTSITCDAKDLQLFLAKKDEGRGAWVTEEEAMSGVGDTTDLKLLKSARAAIGDIGLSEDEVRLQVTKGEVEDLKGPVHVLLVVPDQHQAASIKKQLRYKGMSTEASCRKFLDALAQNLAMLYDFECSYGGVLPSWIRRIVRRFKSLRSFHSSSVKYSGNSTSVNCFPLFRRNPQSSVRTALKTSRIVGSHNKQREIVHHPPACPFH